MKPVFVVMLCLLGAVVPQLRGAGHTSEAPNIVYILADDLGYGDVGCYNPSSKIPTPNLNRLAREGMRFTDAHAPSSVCTPTRYALLTGRYAWRSPLKRGVLGPWGTPIIAADRLTVPALLRQHGYATAAIGKWHLGLSYTTKDGQPAALGEDKMSNVDFTKPIADGPTARGFDYYFGVNVPNYPPYCFIENDRTVGIPSARDGGEADGINMPGPMLQGWKLVDVLPELARRTERWIVEAGKAAKAGKPFFLYLPLTSPHFPVVPAPEFKGKSQAGDYGDFVVQTDDCVGGVLAALEQAGVAENTLVIFTSDNGPETAGEVSPGAYDRIRKHQHASMGELRGVKRDLWEGGHRVPFIARWPGKIPPAAVSDETICHVDFMATIAALLDAKLPPNAGEDSFNLLPVLRGAKPTRPVREAVVHHAASGRLAIRSGDWVLIESGTGDDNRGNASEPVWLKKERGYEPEQAKGQLFNLRDDPAQKNNLYATQPERVRELEALLDKYRCEGRSTSGPAQSNDPPLASSAKSAVMRAERDAPLNDLIERATQGDASAQLSLAVKYRDGNAVKTDHAKALRWARIAADRGDAAAMDFVGWMFFKGLGVKQNATIAVGYFKAAADKSAQAAWNLGQCYFGAQGVEQDVPKALQVWKKAADMGHGRAAATTAMVYLAGEGIAPDAAQARQFAERAVELNDPAGCVVLGELHFQAGEFGKARELWSKVARMNPTRPTSNPEQPSGELASQLGADLLRLMDYRQRKAEPGKFALVPMSHIHQGWNNCGATSCAMFARAQGKRVGGWDYKKLCPSPLGTGTDWGDLLKASEKLGLRWKLVTFTLDDDGFDKATAFVRGELDAGRPVVIDFKYTGPQYPNGEAGHTLAIAGYIAQENLYILCNPALPTPGLQLISAADLKHYWCSDHYGELSNNVLSRPAIVVAQP